jgi:hypothetical protein
MSKSSAKSTSQLNGEARFSVPLATDLVVGWLGGAVWVGTGLVLGLPVSDLSWLAAPAALTLSVLLLAASAWAALPAWRGPLALGAAGLGAVAFVLGHWLQMNTNHRPLGAVTWACACALAVIPIALFVRSTPRLQRLGSWLLLAVVLVIVGAAARDAEWRLWAPLLSGAACLSICVYLRRRLQVPAWAAGVGALVLIAGWIALARSDEAARLAEVAPIWLGAAIVLR